MKILAIQNRMGIGDMVIFLPFIEAISKKFKVPISILVKENSKAAHFLSENPYIDKIIILDRDNKNRNGRHDGIKGIFSLASDIKKYSFEKVFIFNSSIRFNLICKFSGIKNIYQYPLLKKKNQHIIKAAQNFLKKKIGINVKSDPYLFINENSIIKAKSQYSFNSKQKNILLGIGGSGDTKRIPSKTFIKLMKLVLEKYDCRFLLATGTKKEEQIILNEILNTELNSKCFSLDKLNLIEILPIIKNCDIAVCNDSSFSHLSSALGIQTIVLMSDTPLLYGNYSPRMHPIIPDGEVSVKHDTLGKNKINSYKIFEKFKEIIN